ncbi:beta-N-acetylhexosaminidase [Clostridium celatum]|uniref:beta-N-acetylhexosaminidase n=1 Tax=Clostridium celatum TaxID=36834 RepID=UPI00189B2EB2|nr:beta-N-acetylhexosaminidase [Clostridium celatum]MCE9655725.1 beta-N-acetylhexosaminidase [Clostridium celatum]MDU2264779.1 beta-N-acetylhexosaminidase [Clostridium celatum]MDU3722283.1 beta-N-acetylhexosaminidase [Clostridium celatum]MDU6294407.1 beta-N-acetylhexosaminidase [Clostridium celatum]MDY3360246.1 beta-N-acetylhexosaminidase [Clostridium celatum]
MKRAIIFIILIIGITFFWSCKDNNINDNNIDNKKLDSKEENIVDKSTKEENEDKLQKNIEEMSLNEKIGQMLIVGFDGQNINENIKSLILDNHVGGVIFFSNNVESLEGVINLTNEFKKINTSNKFPLFIAVDEEGGSVSRTPNEFLAIPSAQYIGAFDDENINYNIGKIIADELKQQGYNMDFAPSLDILSNPYNTVIGDRSYGETSDIVSRLGIKTMEGIRDSSIVSVIKHFPGHGDTDVDSHYGLPLVEKSLAELKELELIPFENAIKAGADAIMISHILLTKIDSENPATMSKEVITNVLRENMEFDGVVITDDMTMGAIIENYDIGEASVKSINAGADIILVCHGYENELNVINSIKNAVKNNIISEERINESVYRILKLKEKYKITNENIEINTDVSNINKRIENIFD